ncbi:hypothetical protein [Haloactinopolyspora alba]|nr:hypothetical protein [Haloactinopolyspora alba]
MDRVSGEHEKTVAVLHDVLEDTDVTAADLHMHGCPQNVIRAVEALTKLPGEPLAESIARAAADPIARIVKRCDVADNTDPGLLELLDPDHRMRLEAKYADTLRLLAEYSPGHASSRG